MASESGKIRTIERRMHNLFFDKYCVGKGIDIGTSSSDPENLWWKDLKLDCEPYEKGTGPHASAVSPERRGDATYMAEIADESYDWVYSSHCLEHIKDHETALVNWLRILKPHGYLIVYIPHVDYYERKETKPSIFNEDHKHFYHPFYEGGEIESVYKLFSKICGSNNIVYLNECSTGCTPWYKSIHEKQKPGGEYSIEVVVRKDGPRLRKISEEKKINCFSDF